MSMYTRARTKTNINVNSFAYAPAYYENDDKNPSRFVYGSRKNMPRTDGGISFRSVRSNIIGG